MTIHELTHAVIPLLGDKWRITTRTDEGGREYPVAAITHADGYSLTLHGPSWAGRGRIEISGTWPSDAQGQQHYPREYSDVGKQQRRDGKIGLSDESTPERVAQQITKRLLPKFLPVWEELRKQAASADAYHNTTEATQAALVAAGLQAGRNGSDTMFASSGSPIYKAQVSGDSIRLELHGLTLAQAQQVIAVVGA